MGRFRDITGQQFGEWTAIKYLGNRDWLCRCSCGVEKVKKSYALFSGDSKSCGHNRNGFIDLTGQIIGEWTVLKYVGNKKWLCRCSCGAEKEVYGITLRNGDSTSCGHSNHQIKDMLGQTVGEWTIIRDEGHGNWLCRCSCGAEKVISGRQLRAGETKSCGHNNNAFKDLTNQRFGEWTAIKYLSDGYWLCRCSCGSVKNVHRYLLLSGNSKSCGCKSRDFANETMISRYNELSPKRLDNVREQWQISIPLDKEKLSKFIQALGYKPTINELADIFNVTHSAILHRIHKYEIEDLINFNPYYSKEESEIYTYLVENHNVEVDTHKNIKQLNQELDIYIPDLKLAIEFNGDYWHSTKFKNKYYHQNKVIACIKNGIKLIHIFEYDWINNKEDVIRMIDNNMRYVITNINNIVIDTYNKDNYIDIAVRNAGEIIGNIQVDYSGNIINYNMINCSSKCEIISKILNILKDKGIKTFKIVQDLNNVNIEEFIKNGFIIKNIEDPEVIIIDKITRKKLHSTECDIPIFKIYDCGKIIMERK